MPTPLARIIPDLIAAGILVIQSDAVAMASGLVVVLAFSNWLICQPPQLNPSYYFGDDSIALLTRLTPKRGGNHLDLCSGTGLHALYAAKCSDRVFAVEIDEMASSIAFANARLNSITNIEVRQGNLFEAVPGMKFDSISANPPLLPYPDGIESPTIGNGGTDGLRVTWKILHGLDRALADKGTAQLIGMGLSNNNSPNFLGELRDFAEKTCFNVYLTVVNTIGFNSETFGHVVASVAAVSRKEQSEIRSLYAEICEAYNCNQLCSYFLRIDKWNSGEGGQVFHMDFTGMEHRGLWHL